MKRPWLIPILGIALAAASYGLLVSRRAAALQDLESACGPELAWIKTEFQLDAPTFERVRVLHEAYKPVCAENCRKIDEQQEALAALLATSDQVTPEIRRLVVEANRLRAECQTEMLEHFFSVSQAMPPEQGRRYLAWMHAQTIAPAHSTMLPHLEGAAPHVHPAH